MKGLIKELKHSALEKTARFGRDPFALIIVVLAGLGTAQLPAYPGRIYIGRWIDGNSRTFWEAEFSESR